MHHSICYNGRTKNYNSSKVSTHVNSLREIGDYYSVSGTLYHPFTHSVPPRVKPPLDWNDQ